MIKIYTDMCQIVNGKKQCKVYCNGRTDLDQNTSENQRIIRTVHID